MTYTLPSNNDFYFPSTTINISGLNMNQISSIQTCNQVTGFSYGDFNNGIMLNIDCRKHLEERAVFYAKQYLKDKSNISNKNDDIYFIEKLKDCPKKNELMNLIK